MARARRGKADPAIAEMPLDERVARFLDPIAFFSPEDFALHGRPGYQMPQADYQRAALQKARALIEIFEKREKAKAQKE